MAADLTVPNLLPALPEIVLAIGAMLLLMVGVFAKQDVAKKVTNLSLLILAAVFVLVVSSTSERVLTFGGGFVMDGFAVYAKALVLIGSFVAVLVSPPYLKEKGINKFEFPALILLATLGMMMMISANDMLALYVGLELQSLSLYVLAAFNKDRARSSEAGLKYFVLGALSSGMLLYGISIVYGFSGTIGFDALAGLGHDAPIGLVVGMVFVLAGLAFKISAVPFHMWTPDVYEGSPTPVTAFFAVAPKIAAMALFMRIVFGAFPDLVHEWQQIVVFLSVASMLVGAFVALVQTNIKRLLAYSSIGHVGYALVGVVAGTADGVQGVLVYLTIYMTMTIGAFVAVLSMKNDEGMTEQISDLAGLSKTRPMMAMSIAIFMFSLAGIPLLAGFFGKFFIFKAAVDAGFYTLALIGVVASVVGAYYYLRIVKIMYFDEPQADLVPIESKSMGLVMGLAAAVNSPLSFLLIGPLLAAAGAAAASLMS